MRILGLVLLSCLLGGCSLSGPLAAIGLSFDTRSAQDLGVNKVEQKSLSNAADWGGETVYEPFSTERYDNSIYSGELIVMNFVSDKCQTCNAEEPDLVNEFINVDPRKVSAFRVDLNSTNERVLEIIDKYGVKQPLTKIVLKNGDELFRETRVWNREDVRRILDNY